MKQGIFYKTVTIRGYLGFVGGSLVTIIYILLVGFIIPDYHWSTLWLEECPYDCVRQRFTFFYVFQACPRC
jgi:hypothetical protein